MKIAVHLHLFYKEMAGLFLNKLKNLPPNSFDLFVTLSNKDDELIEQIQKSYPQAKIKVIENRGYDIGPFIYFLHQIDLSKYDLILKLHTKNDKGNKIIRLNNRQLTRYCWSHLLIDSLIKDKKTINKNLVAFEQKTTLGMIGSNYLLCSVKKNSIPSVFSGFEEEMFKLFPKDKQRQDYHFIAGTMFFVRAKLLEKVKEKYHFSSFEKTDGRKRDGTLAHILERAFGAIVIQQGFVIEGFDFSIGLCLNKIFSFFFKVKITKKGYFVIKFLKIPIWRKRIEE